MLTLIDTCALSALCKYYIPFDSDKVLYSYIENQFMSGNLIIIDSVLEECRYQSQGFILKNLPFLSSKALARNTVDILPPSPRKFSNMLDKNFSVPIMRKRLTDEQFAMQRDHFLNTGDARMVIYILNSVKEEDSLLSNYCILTEESRNQNDGKLFKKLPSICDQLSIATINLVQYLKKTGLNLIFAAK